MPRAWWGVSQIISHAPIKTDTLYRDVLTISLKKPCRLFTYVQRNPVKGIALTTPQWPHVHRSQHVPRPRRALFQGADPRYPVDLLPNLFLRAYWELVGEPALSIILIWFELACIIIELSFIAKFPMWLVISVWDFIYHTNETSHYFLNIISIIQFVIIRRSIAMHPPHPQSKLWYFHYWYQRKDVAHPVPSQEERHAKQASSSPRHHHSNKQSPAATYHDNG